MQQVCVMLFVKLYPFELNVIVLQPACCKSITGFLVHTLIVRESVDSLCRDGADAQYMQYLKQKLYNFTTNAYLSAQTSTLSVFVINTTHISVQKAVA